MSKLTVGSTSFLREGDVVRFFFDTEFIEDGKTIDLISIGIVSEDGREFYALNADCDWSKANEWVRTNVLAHLPQDNSFRSSDGWLRRGWIPSAILDFVGQDTPEFWAYYADYDWVALCQLYGRMIDLPKGWPMYCRDVKQLCDSLGNPKLPEQASQKHYALNDARWTKQAYEFLMARAQVLA